MFIHGKNRGQNGFTLAEVIISFGLLGLVVVGGTSLLNNYVSTVKMYAKAGEIEDIRRYFRNSLDCRNTVRTERTTCASNGHIRGIGSNNNPLIASANSGRNFASHNVKLRCNEHPTYYEIQGTVTESDGSTQELFEVPRFCSKLDCQGLPVWGDPMVFRPAWGAHGMLALVRGRASVCGQPMPAHELTRSTGADKRTSAHQRNYGVEHLPTLKQVCKILGYKTYVSSGCRDFERSGRYPNGKCNWHSNGDEHHSYYNGNSWSNFHKPYHRTWLTTITCRDKV